MLAVRRQKLRLLGIASVILSLACDAARLERDDDGEATSVDAGPRVVQQSTAARVVSVELTRGTWLEPAVLRGAYGESADVRLRFTTTSGLGESGRAVVAALRQLPDAHALEETTVFAVEPIERLVAALAGTPSDTPARARLELMLADRLAHLARGLGLGNARPAALRQRWKEQRRWRSLDRQPARVTPDADGRLWGWRYFAFPYRWLIAPAVLARAAQRDGPPDPRLYPEQHVQRLLAEGIARIDDSREVASLLTAATPPIQQYDRLVGARARYRAMVRQGGWPRIGSTRGLRPGRRHRAVAKLRRRLALEGYLPDASSSDADRFDDALVEAVRGYQRNHQLDVTGRLDRATVAQLDVSAELRLAAIERALRRWRRTGAGSAGVEVRINIPGFSLEVWRGPERLLRQRVIVGKRYGTRCDEHLAQKVWAFRTPLLASQIEHVVFCPYWNVTQTIKETELDPEHGKDPLYYYKHGYELLREDTLFEWVRQLPGPENSLGLAKLIFSNPYEIYLHDTPEKHLFSRPRRSYSHGCIRVADVVGLVRALLKEDGQWHQKQFAKLHRMWRSMRFAPLRKQWDPDRYAELVKRAAQLRQEVFLRRPIPIHVEYHTVRVDDQGRVAFYQDVYGYEQPERPGRRCVPDSVRARRGFANLLERLAKLQEELTPLTERIAKATTAGHELLPPQAKLPYQQRRLRRKLASLERFAQDHANLAQRIREDHAAVDGPIRRRDQRRLRQAVRIQRLVDALEALHHKAKQTCERVERLKKKTADDEG